VKKLNLNIRFSKALGRNVAIITLPEKYQVLSSAIVGGGFTLADTFVILQVDENYHNPHPEDDLLQACKCLGIDNAVGFMTAADIKKVLSTSTETIGEIEAIAVVTAGTSNAVIAGDQNALQMGPSSANTGTINVISVLNVPLEKSALVNAAITVTEAKTAALLELGIKATGTTTDAIAIATPIGDGYKYAGTATKVGMAISKSVKNAVMTSIKKAGEAPPPMDILKMLQEMGVDPQDLWETAKELYVHNPNWNTETLKNMFINLLNNLRKDVNVNALFLAAAILDEIGRRGEIYGLSPEEFIRDPVHLIADEMIGMILAEYIAGIKGLLEYERYDREKPRIIRKLGPFLDDAVASLIGGIMSRIYTKLLEEET